MRALPEGLVVLEEGAGLEASLAPAERVVAAAFAAEKRREDWVRGRAAAKAAVRALLAREGCVAPAAERLVIAADASGAPSLATACGGAPIVVSLSHGHGLAAAWALRAGAEGGLPGVDLERVRPRPPGTLRFYLSPEEREPVLALEGGEGEVAGPRDDRAVLLWAVKEAAFKALRPPRGLGLLDVRCTVGPAGVAAVEFVGQLRPRAERLGVRETRAGWARRGDVYVAWVEAVGGAPQG